MSKHKLQIKRAYSDVEKSDGKRFLVDRLWPRGIKKEKLQIESWIKEAGPSTELRKWFNHEVDKWMGFQEKYLKELQGNREILRPIRIAMHDHDVTLVYSAKDEQHNQAVVLQRYLTKLGALKPEK